MGKDISNVDIIPLFPKKLDSVNAYHDTPSGRISVAWERTGENALVLKIEADERLYGKIVLPRGFAFSDGSAEKELESREYALLMT